MLAIARSTTEVLFVLAAAWLATGITLAVVMGRRGHGAFQWLLIGTVLGPLALPLAWIAIRDEPQMTPRPLSSAMSSGGPVDVLVGIDGSPQAMNALRVTLALVGSNVGRLVLAHVSTFDETPQARRDEEHAMDVLETAASSLHEFTPGRVLLRGRPAEALVQHATDEGFHLLAIGRRGSGASKAILGSTAARATSGSIPVLVV